jgi:glycosyltransferase involved in cell wall biosynthesis
MISTSIAMCTYNGERFLQQQLDSLAAQEILPNELIVCDDASTDGTFKILENFAKNAKFKVKIFRNSINLGYVKNFEKAISLCTCDIIFLCDQDDIWGCKKIEEVVHVFADDPSVGLVLHGYKKIDSTGKDYAEAEDKYGVSKLTSVDLPDEIKNNSIEVFLLPVSRAWCGCMMAYRKKFNDLIIPIFPGKGHDDWILKIVAPVSEVRFISNKLIEYRMHNGNTNNFEKKTISLRFSRMLKRIEKVIKGYSKRNFYAALISRINCSNFLLRHPNLIVLYKKYC